MVQKYLLPLKPCCCNFRCQKRCPLEILERMMKKTRLSGHFLTVTDPIPRRGQRDFDPPMETCQYENVALV
jgi:hypothetical protein